MKVIIFLVLFIIENNVSFLLNEKLINQEKNFFIFIAFIFFIDFHFYYYFSNYYHFHPH